MMCCSWRTIATPSSATTKRPVRARQGAFARARRPDRDSLEDTGASPAVRLGRRAGGPRRRDAACERLVDDFSPALDQLALARLIASGEYDRHLRRARAAHRRRRDKLPAALARFLPYFGIEGVAAGVHLLLRLPRGVDDLAIVVDARQAGVAVHALSAFHVQRRDDPRLVIGCGRLHEAAVVPATRALARIVENHRRPGTPA